ncbi:MAG: hypothetical protein RLY31_1397 [Bacteroidota bacterium]|jgi:dolichol-phosphate mannosyltransferase
MKLSIVMPAYNEADSLPETIAGLEKVFLTIRIDHEILVVNDNSSDDTAAVLDGLCKEYPHLRYVTNPGPNGFGYAVRFGLDRFEGDCVAIMMADLSDSPYDLVKYYTTMMEQHVDCVFGTRWSRGGKTFGYPWIKKIINRLANKIIQAVMGIGYDDTTNAFKLFRREVIDGLRPFLAPHFNLTIELPLKAIIRGYSYAVVPNSWTNRKYGMSKLKIREMGSRYFFILAYCFIEKYFSRGDFKKKW